jgi:hypothetical protein
MFAFNRHRGSGHPLSPATPPYMRVRIRRFSSVGLKHTQQPRKTERIEVSHRKGGLQGRTVGQTPGTMRTAGGLSRASPLAVGKSRSTAVPESLASAASGSPATPTLSCRRSPDCPYWPSLVLKPVGSSLARRPLPSVALLQPDFRFRISPPTIRSLPAEPLELPSSPPR